jgi:hypothetical protein
VQPIRNSTRVDYGCFEGPIAREIAPRGTRTEEEIMARKTVLVCDKCGSEVDEGKGAILRVTFNDARRGAKQADLCDA